MRLVISLMCLWLLHSSYSAPSFLTISDIHFGIGKTSEDGHDTGEAFLTVALNKFQKISQNVDFILYLGDLPAHSFFIDPKRAEYEKIVFHGLYQADKYMKPMFYIPGNNDSLGGNYKPFEFSGISPLNNALDWTGACVYCRGLVRDGSHMYSGGYYSSYVMPNNKDILLIALNATQLMITPLLAGTYPNQDHDAQEQLAWLEKQLKNNHAKQLLIAMHEPPGMYYDGKTSWQEPYLKQFIQLLEQNQSRYHEITLLSAHTHMDEIRKIQLKNNKNIYLFATPSVSRDHHNNPGMKQFDLNPQLQIKNYTTYYTLSTTEWGDEFYDASNSAKAIFPGCHDNTLAQCLDKMSDSQVCTDMSKGLFYSVKSPRVNTNGCRSTYLVN